MRNPTLHPSMQARLRRAVSTAYYALFHCLAASAADLFIGPERNPAWHRTYRALEHGRARSECRQVQTMPEFPVEVRGFAEAFVALQKARQEADYALDTPALQQSDVLGYVVSAEIAIRRFEQATLDAVSSPMCCFGSDRHRRSDMNHQQVRDIAEAAFKARFGDIGIVSIDVKPGFDHCDDPMLDVRIVYDAEVERLIAPDKAPDMVRVRSEIVEKVWAAAENSPGYPYIHFIAKSDLEEDPATA